MITTTPAPMGVRAAHKRATRDALIEAGLAEFAEHGPVTPSLDAICARAGYTRGAFYVHFRDRDDLVVAVMERVLGGLLGAMTAAGRAEVGGLRGAIGHFTAAAVARSPAVHGDRAVRFHHILEACRSSAVIGDRYLTLLGGLAAWVSQSAKSEQRAGRLRHDVGAEAIAELVMAAGLGLVVLLELGLAVDPPRLGETVLTLVQPASTATRPRRRAAIRSRAE